ncbi:response regulator transcription factor [Streptomyces anulatus]|uniref:response regulator transcription factor n=1 Tax=Streptomyces anulatus TaxID=1892 RepID=UPI00386C9268
MIRVALADDQLLVRAGFRALLDAQPDIEVAGEAADGEDTEPEELLRAVRAVVSGDALLSPGVTRRLIAEFAARSKEPTAAASLARLTEREREVMALVGIGLSNEEIARRLVVSPLTAKTHVSRTMVKLGARDRAQLVVLAYESGLVRPGWLG